MMLSSKKADTVARDVSWHPTYPVIASTSFDGDINTWTLQNDVQQEPEEIPTSDPLTQDRELLRRMFGQHLDVDDMDEDDI